MTELETQVLQTEDELDNRFLRNLVPYEDFYNFDWKKDRSHFTGLRETFTGLSGPTFDVADKSPVDIFHKIFDTDLIDRKCTETNRYAEQKISLLKAENKLARTSRLLRWTPTDRDEMITFLAVMILQGLYPFPEEEKYFSFNGFGSMPYFSRIMSYNRYWLLKSLYHFVDNETLTERTKLCKIQPVLDHLNEKFSTLYMPSQEISINESLLKRHGRLSFSRKTATKAAQVGVETYELCESSSGYLWKFFVNVGKNTPTDRIAPAKNRSNIDEMVTRPINATAKIVYDLVEPLLFRGHTLIMDNVHNSPLLFRYLKRYKMDCYRTLRLNREFVPDSVKSLTQTDLRRGEVVASYCPDLSVIVWRDVNLVSMISTYHYLQIGAQENNNRLTYKPIIVLDYNKSMGGIDTRDKFLSTHPIARQRNRVWYKKVFRRLLNTSVFNAFVIFSSWNPLSQREFRTILTEDLLKLHRRIDLSTEPRLYVNWTGPLTIRNTERPTTADNGHFPARAHKKRALAGCARAGNKARGLSGNAGSAMCACV